MSTTDEKTLFISDFRTLPAYQNAREKQEALVKENPFIEITDSKSFDSAKKARTALRQGRYDLQNGEKLITSKLTEFRKDVGEETKKLIDITIEAEEKQQAEVERWEAEVKAKKEEAKRLEQLRIDKIKNSIIEFRLKKTEVIRRATLENIEVIIKTITETTMDCEEFQQDFDMVREQLLEAANEKQEQLQEAERVRVENERLAEEKKKLEAERKKMEEQRKKEEAELKAEREKIEQQRKAENDKLKAERDKLLEQKRQMELQKEKEAEAEKQRQLEEQRKKEAIEIKRRTVEMEHLGYELKDNQFVFGNIIIEMKEVTESAQFDEYDLPKFERIIEGEINRIEAVKPDKEKLLAEVDSLATLPKDLRLQNDAAQQLYAAYLAELALLKEKYKNEVSNL